VCLGRCGTDVVVNALVLFWVTDPASEKSTLSGPGLTPCPVQVSYMTDHDQHPPFSPADTKTDHEDLESKPSRAVSTKGLMSFFGGGKRRQSNGDAFGATSVEVRITRETDVVHESSVADTEYEMRNMDTDK